MVGSTLRTDLRNRFRRHHTPKALSRHEVIRRSCFWRTPRVGASRCLRCWRDRAGVLWLDIRLHWDVRSCYLRHAVNDTDNYPAHIYAKDDSASAEVYVRDEAGNVTKLSPHNKQGEWEYYSKNTKTGKVVRVNMEEMVRDIEKLTGKTYIKEE